MIIFWKESKLCQVSLDAHVDFKKSIFCFFFQKKVKKLLLSIGLEVNVSFVKKFNIIQTSISIILK